MRTWLVTLFICLTAQVSVGQQHGVLLDGQSGHGTVPDNPAYHLGAGDFTLEALVRFTNVENANQSTILAKNATANQEYLALEYSYPEGQTFYFGGRGGGTEWFAGVHNYLPVAGECYHVAGVRYGNVFTFYLNGVAMNSQTRPVGDPSNAGNWDIGWMSTSEVCRCFPGVIDEVRVWTVARSQEEIQQNMYSSLTGQEPNLVAYWAMDEATGNLVHDSSPTANTGSLTGGYDWLNYACEPGVVDAGPEVLADFDLLPARPNPFNPSTDITFSLPTTGWVNLSVYNLAGERMAVLHDGLATAGLHTVAFQAGNLPSGIYITRLQTEVGQISRRVALVK